MSGTVIPFRPRKRLAVVPPVPAPLRPQGCAIVLAVRGRSVTLVVDCVELELSPEQARDLGMDLVELAREAEGSRG